MKKYPNGKLEDVQPTENPASRSCDATDYASQRSFATYFHPIYTFYAHLLCYLDAMAPADSIFSVQLPTLSS